MGKNHIPKRYIVTWMGKTKIETKVFTNKIAARQFAANLNTAGCYITAK